ncbi:retrovirus-related pol polyprotein from transposon TNT 1-94 [Tanacetum coccineum]
MAKLRFRMFKKYNLRVMAVNTERVKLWETRVTQITCKEEGERLEEIEDCDDLQLQTTSDFKADHVDAYDSDCDDEATVGICPWKTIGQLHALLIEYEKGLPKKAATPQLMAIQGGRIQKANKKSLNAKDYKALEQDRGDEYISQDFKDYLIACGIVQQLTPPYTPQHNRVSERRNHTLLDMVRSIMNLTTLAYPFGFMLLEDCYTHSQYGSNQKGHLKETMCYYFYFSPENKIVIVRYAKFLEKNLISQKVSGRAEELEEIQDKDTSPSENTSKIPMEVEGFEPPQEDAFIEVEEHSLGDLNEPNNYKAAILDPKSDKCIDAMNAEIQSMKDNQVWCLVDLPPNCKIVGSKWLFKKKTDMDGIVHTYKARLVAKGFTQTYGVDYEEYAKKNLVMKSLRLSGSEDENTPWRKELQEVLQRRGRFVRQRQEKTKGSFKDGEPRWAKISSSSGTKEIKFVKAQKKASSDGGPINMGGPQSVQAAPKTIMGPPPVGTPRSEKNICLGVDLEPDEWIKDSGCSKHMTGNRKLFSSYKAYNGGNVIFGSNLRGNIISKGQICDNKCRVTFSEHDSEITKDGKVIGRGIRKKGLYVMKLGNKPKDQICLATIDENSMLWHRRLGHANMRLIQSLASKELVRNLSKLKFDQHFCDACKIRKQAYTSHKAKNIVSMTRCLELLHMDLLGPSAVRSYGGNRYTLVIVDDYSRYTWTIFLKNKTEAFDQFEIFSKKIQNQLGCTIVLIRTDHDREFDNEVQFGEFCNSNGITHNFSAPRTPQSNGVVEKKNRTLQEMSYSQNSKAYIILNKHTRKVEEPLNVTFDETHPPSKTLPLVDDDLDEEEAIKVTEKKNLENDIVDETLEIDEIVNIKESRNHPLENVIGNLNQKTLRSQAKNQSNFFCFISTIEPKNVNEALTDDSWIVAMQEELNQFTANDVWENGIVSRNEARLVAQGYNQQEGIDYDETYALVARLESIRILLAYTYALDFNLFQMNVKNAFLNGFIKEEVKQLPDGIFISQDKYVKDMLTKFNMESVRTVTIPYEAAKTNLKDETDPPVNVHLYRSMIGSLMYLTASRPDIMFAVSACSRRIFIFLVFVCN